MKLRDYILEKKHHAFRKEHPQLDNLAEEFSRLGLSPEERMTRRFELLTSLETPVLLDGEQICFLRTVKSIPDCFTLEEWAAIRSRHFIHELGYLSNLSPNYERVIGSGLLACREAADPYGQRAIDAIIRLADRYREAALATGKEDLADVLTQVPRYGARTFREALQFFRILHFSLWLEGNYHNTAGRVDKYLYPYLKADMDKGLLTRETALSLVEDFFLSFNKDSDLYVGVQQGDNGQSLVLGGVDEDGNEVFNLLSRLCLEASGKLLLIDPKINLRVSKSTPDEIYELGTQLTKAGLGFPQYSNDDVVIPGLVKLGYDLTDARNYAIAACWEFIIPGTGYDVANIGALSFPKVIDEALHEALEASPTMDAFLAAVDKKIFAHCHAICENIRDLWFVPSPFMQAMLDGSKYNNFGIHGTGIATAADSLAAIAKYIYEEKRFTPAQLIRAVDTDFAEHSELLPLLRYEAPKMGTDTPGADSFACWLLDTFADALAGKQNCRGGIYRPGTGSAMYYLWHAQELGASPDGRRRGEPFGTNFSPSLFARISGPLSVIRSFTKPDLQRVINGGPLTLEFAASMFTTDDSVRKVAQLVKGFVGMGGHQLQLNAVNTKLLLEAQAHPELHRQLVVRIWGWSAYFVELDKPYQEHVLRRQQYRV